MLDNVEKQLNRAESWLNQGWVVMPTSESEQRKKPQWSAWKPLASCDDIQALGQSWIDFLEKNQHWNGNLANVLQQGVVVLDFDSVAEYDKFCTEFGKPDTMIVSTPKGYHVYFSVAEKDQLSIKTNTAVTIGSAVCDVRSGNPESIGYVVCDGWYIRDEQTHNYFCEEIWDVTELPTVPQAILPFLKNQTKGNDNKQLKVLNERLEELRNATKGARNHPANILAFLVGKSVAEGICQKVEWEAKYFEACAECGYAKKDATTTFEAGYKSGYEAGGKQIEIGKRLVRVVDKPKRTYANLSRALQEIGEVTQNLWTQELKYIDGVFANKPFTRATLGEIQVYISENFQLEFSIGDIHTILQAIAKKYNPICEWLETLTWDGTPRLDEFFCDTFGVEDSPIVKQASDALIYGALKRAIEPGCKFDEVVVLVGEQGLGKSTFLKSFYLTEYVDTSAKKFDNLRQTAPTLNRSWVVEFGELNSMTRARDYSETKDFLSQNIDRYVPVYESIAIDAPRHCIFVGTTNDNEFLTDPTGNRRFIPIRVNKRLTIEDQKAIEAQRDQLWAEAYIQYKNGKRFVPDYQLLLDNAKQFEIQDAMTGEVLEAAQILTVNGKDFTIAEIMDLIQLPATNRTRFYETKIGKILKDAGYQKGPQKRIGNTRIRTYSPLLTVVK